jgi:exoribonuclease-2
VSRTSYEAAENRLEETPFAEIWAFVQTFQQKRLRHGAIEIDLPEVRVRVKEGEVMVRPLPNLRSRNLVREAMLMTGEAVARYALAHHIPLPFTTQEPPEGEVPPAAATPAENFALRRMMKRGQQKVAAAPHAGLGMPLYVQATSPLRRYLDMVVHQQLRRHLQLQTSPEAPPLLTQADILARIGSADAITGTLRQTERLSNTHWILVYLRRNPDWQGEGVIIEKFGSRDLVLIPDLAYETEMYLRKDTALDDRMVVAVSEVNLPELTAHFRTR